MCSISRIVEGDLSSLNDAAKPFEQWQSAIRRLFSEEGILANVGRCLLDLLTMCPSPIGKEARSSCDKTTQPSTPTSSMERDLLMGLLPIAPRLITVRASQVTNSNLPWIKACLCVLNYQFGQVWTDAPDVILAKSLTPAQIGAVERLGEKITARIGQARLCLRSPLPIKTMCFPSNGWSWEPRETSGCAQSPFS